VRFSRREASRSEGRTPLPSPSRLKSRSSRTATGSRLQDRCTESHQSVRIRPLPLVENRAVAPASVEAPRGWSPKPACSPLSGPSVRKSGVKCRRSTSREERSRTRSSSSFLAELEAVARTGEPNGIIRRADETRRVQPLESPHFGDSVDFGSALLPDNRCIVRVRGRPWMQWESRSIRKSPNRGASWSLTIRTNTATIKWLCESRSGSSPQLELRFRSHGGRRGGGGSQACFFLPSDPSRETQRGPGSLSVACDAARATRLAVATQAPVHFRSSGPRFARHAWRDGFPCVSLLDPARSPAHALGGPLGRRRWARGMKSVAARFARRG